jgi:hypothetical protein
VDGYDEISLTDRKRVSESLQRSSASRRGRFILTASHVPIDGFNRKDQYRFVTAFLAAQGSSVDPIKLVNKLEERQFAEFLSHPLLLALACIVSSGYRTEQSRSPLRLLRKALITLQAYVGHGKRGLTGAPHSPRWGGSNANPKTDSLCISVAIHARRTSREHHKKSTG